MISGGRLWCSQCKRMAQHTFESGVTEWGVTWQHERCGHCRATSQPFSGSHEIPRVAPTAPLDPETLIASAGLTHRRKHLEFTRWLVERGIVNDADGLTVAAPVVRRRIVRLQPGEPIDKYRG